MFAALPRYLTMEKKMNSLFYIKYILKQLTWSRQFSHGETKPRAGVALVPEKGCAEGSGAGGRLCRTPPRALVGFSGNFSPSFGLLVVLCFKHSALCPHSRPRILMYDWVRVCLCENHTFASLELFSRLCNRTRGKSLFSVNWRAISVSDKMTVFTYSLSK